MEKIANEIENYLAALPFKTQLHFADGIENAAKEVERLLSLGKNRPFSRMKSVKNLVKLVLATLELETKVKFHIFDKRKAYMSDKNFVSFSLRFIFYKDSVRITKIVFHEIGHIALRAQAFYGELLQREDGVLENLASQISIEIIRQIMTVISDKKLENIVTDEQQKLYAVIKREKGVH